MTGYLFASIKNIGHGFACHLCAILLVIYSYSPAAQTHITVPFTVSTTPDEYYRALLVLALAKTEQEYGKLELRNYPYSYGKERERATLKNNLGIDIVWCTTNTEREEHLLAIKFDLLRGLSNKKILLIRAEDKDKFSKIDSINQLRNYKAGTGSYWQDTEVLKRNNMPHELSPSYESLFKMLAAHRFDYVIRGAQEITNEIKQHPSLPIIAEETLLITYELPVYYFVNKNNVQLAERIKAGLEIAEKDGSLDELFFSFPSFQQGYAEVHNKQRKMIKMESAK